MSKLFIGIIYATIAQILTYLQLQGNIRWNWYEKYPIIIYGMSIPMTFLYIKSVECFVKEFDGQVWPSRLIGFSIGIIVFSIMTEVFFKEPITHKTIVTIILAVLIVLIQIFWK
jgi:hypothetical protein